MLDYILIPMMNTELRHIRHVVTLGKHLSFTQAAKELGITQSALTRSIQAIEEKAQARLFDRDRGRVSLTEVGKAYFKRAEALLQEADDLDRLLHETAVGEIGEVHFGMTSSTARALLPEILVQELHHRPRLREMIHIQATDVLLRSIQSEELEFCVCAEQPALPESLRMTIIGTMPLSLLVRPEHPLPSDTPVLDLTAYPLLMSSQPNTGNRVAELVSPARLAPPSVIIDDIGVLAHVTTNSDAIWLTAPVAIPTAMRQGLFRELTLPRSLQMRFRVVMYSHERRSLSPPARRMVDMMRAQAAKWSSGGN